MSITIRQAALMHQAAHMDPAELHAPTLAYVRLVITHAIIRARPEIEAGHSGVQAGVLALFALLEDITDMADLADLGSVAPFAGPQV